MKFKTDPLLVAGFDYWEIDDKPVVNKQGEPVEYVQVIDLDTDEIHRFTLRDVPIADRPDPMTYAVLTCEARTAQKGREDGSVSSRLKVSVVGIEKASPPVKSRPATDSPAKS